MFPCSFNKDYESCKIQNVTITMLKTCGHDAAVKDSPMYGTPQICTDAHKVVFLQHKLVSTWAS